MAGGKLNQDPKVMKFIDRVMGLRNQIVWDVDANPLRLNADKSDTYGALDTKNEPVPGSFHQVTTTSKSVSPAALVEIFQIYAHNITRYRPVRMYVRASNGKAETHHGVEPTALNNKHKLPPSSFKSALPTSLFEPFGPGKKASGEAIDNLIEALRKVVEENMSGSTPYLTITACHNSCHSNCHGSRSRR